VSLLKRAAFYYSFAPIAPRKIAGPSRFLLSFALFFFAASRLTDDPAPLIQEAANRLDICPHMLGLSAGVVLQ
jgi:hypothetical protein